MTGLYPLKFKSILKERVWGGSFLKDVYGKESKQNRVIGESWEISGVQGEISEISNGFLAGNNLEEIIEVYMGDLVGERIYEKFGNEFPLLIKFIDARQDLSIQVHPNDELALERHNAYGKTEMWYIVNSDADAKIYSGFNKALSKEEYKRYLEENSLEEYLNSDKAEKGDVFFIPAGRVHAIGAGNVLVEIQQTSDITYRIYDWGRSGLDGKPRELHTELALDAIDYNESSERFIRNKPEINKAGNLVSCEYFTTNILKLDKVLERVLIDIDSFIIYICTEGSLKVSLEGVETDVQCGETVLIPASAESVLLDTEGATILESYIELKKD